MKSLTGTGLAMFSLGSSHYGGFWNFVTKPTPLRPSIRAKRGSCIRCAAQIASPHQEFRAVDKRMEIES